MGSTLPVRRYFWSFNPDVWSFNQPPHIKADQLVEHETRKLPMPPHGEWQPFTHQRLTWSTMDFLMAYGAKTYSRTALVDLALKESELSGQPFIECFADMCAEHAALIEMKMFPWQNSANLYDGEIRKAPSPAGSWKWPKHLKNVWDTLDLLMSSGMRAVSREMLGDLAVRESKRSGREYGDCFRDVCAYHSKLLERVRVHEGN